MKLPACFRSPSGFFPRSTVTTGGRVRRAGSALLIVLGCVCLLTVLVIAFLLAVGTELSSSNLYLQGVNTKLLSENAINLVIAQLKEGARSTDVANTSQRVAWASQPGMIRTYDDSGNPYKYYKLYSWDNMVGTGAFDETLAAEKPDATWASQPGIYTDLNEPVNGVYPILDPAAQGKVEGFSYTGAPTIGTTNTLPMPVKWLYILKNGAITVGTPASGTKVTVAGASASNTVVGRIAFWTDDETCKVNINTASEGIFWDLPVGQSTEEMGNGDPTLGASAPFGYSTSVPADQEFQRIPGHPATTCLSTVFGFTGTELPKTYNDTTLTWPLSNTDYKNKFLPYYTLSPRYSAGGSQGGTVVGLSLKPPGYRLYDSPDELVFDPGRIDLGTANSALYPGASPSTGRASLGITPAVIEQRRFFITAHSRAPEETLFGTPRISLWPLIYDTPANIRAGTAVRTGKDNFIAYCTSVGGNPYYFQRANAYQYLNSAGAKTTTALAATSSQSPTLDFPAAPNSTLKTNVERNENLYAYLQALTANNLPGFGGNFLSKYPGGPNASGATITDRDQILTEMFDYIRSGPNLSPSTAYSYTPYSIPPAAQVASSGAGSVVPIRIPNVSGSGSTYGLGRSYSIAEVSLVFMAAGVDTATVAANSLDPSSPTPPRKSIGVGVPWAVAVDNTAGGKAAGSYLTVGDPQTNKLQAFLLVRPYNLLPGLPSMSANIRIRVTNLDQLGVSFDNGVTVAPLGFPAAGNAVANFSTVNFGTATTNGGLLEPCWSFLAASNHPLGVNDGTIGNRNFPFYSSAVSLPSGKPAYPSPYGGQDGNPPAATPAIIHYVSPTSTTFTTNFQLNSAGPVQLKIEVLDGVSPMATAPVLQTLYVRIPTMTLPIPSLEKTNGCNTVVAIKEDITVESEGLGPRITATTRVTDPTQMNFYYQMSYDPMVLANRFLGTNVNGLALYNRIIYRGDVVRSFVPNPNSQAAGDMRLLAAMPQQTGLKWPGDTSNDLFVPLGGLPGATYPADSTTGPSSGSVIRQIHSLIYDRGCRSMLTLLQANAINLASTSFSNLVVPSSGGGVAGNPSVLNPASLSRNYAACIIGGSLFPGEKCEAGSAPVVTPELNGAYMNPSSSTKIPGDWTTGMGPLGDGPFLVKPDESYSVTGNSVNAFYFDNQSKTVLTQYYSPNRQIASGIMFGTLPSRVYGTLPSYGTLSPSGNGVPWCTLLFCPNPSANDSNQTHPGFGVGSGASSASSGIPGPTDYPPYTVPPDHLLLDNFWMPVVEPYAISEPFSTAGKVNMNYEIVPFGNYITRSTAVRAVLKSARLMAIPRNSAGTLDANSGTEGSTRGFPQLHSISFSNYYQMGPTINQGGAGVTVNRPDLDYKFRYNINLSATVDDAQSGFQVRFKTRKDIFRSASEICNIFLVPQAVNWSTTGKYYPGLPALPTDASYSSMQAWWSNFQLTGDNIREAPYNQIYPRLTTKSNTFQVQMRTQVITQTKADAAAGVFDLASGDSITGEYRGSAIVERYVNPNQTTPALPDFATTFPTLASSDSTTTMDAYYNYRVVGTRIFSH